MSSQGFTHAVRDQAATHYALRRAMHNEICEELFQTLAAKGIHEHHVRRLIQQPAQLANCLKFALTLTDLQETTRSPMDVIELPDGGLAFKQPVEPLPFVLSDWQTYVRQRNLKAADHMRCTFDEVKLHSVSDDSFGEPLADDVSSIYLVDTAQARVRPEQAHAMLCGFAPESAQRTRPNLAFEVLRYFWDELNNLNAAYIVINAAIKDLGYPVIFNSLSHGKRITFVPGIPRQHSEYTGYYACCA